MIASALATTFLHTVRAGGYLPILSTILLGLLPSAEGIAAYPNGSCPSAVGNVCKGGVLIPEWTPQVTSAGDRAARSIVYFAGLMYMFLGVSIIAERFMASIEVITSKEKDVVITNKKGEKEILPVRIWNETVSNLTLMALGSSAPEILLSVIEIIGKGFEAGDLGPGTIVGSAAFNLFVIIGICIIVIPDGERREIDHRLVFFVTATWSVFAYLWMYIIIGVISPDVVEVWEAVLTFMFFFVTVITAYVADTKIFINKFLPKSKYRAGHKVKSAHEGEVEANGPPECTFSGSPEEAEDEHDQHRRDYIETVKNIRKANPNISAKTLEEMAQLEVFNKVPKSRAFYRMQATRQLIGSGNVIKKTKVEKVAEEDEEIAVPEYPSSLQRIFFHPVNYVVLENAGSVNVFVTRQGGDLSAHVQVDYQTEDGTAKAGTDYVATHGSLNFYSGDTQKTIKINIIDDDLFEEDEHFNVVLSNLQVYDSPVSRENFALTGPTIASVVILDDDHAGVFHFAEKSFVVNESCGTAELRVIRSSGARGRVTLPFLTIEGTARAGQDYRDEKGAIVFENDETEKCIKINIIDDNRYERDEFFTVALGQPFLEDKSVVKDFRAKHNIHNVTELLTKMARAITDHHDVAKDDSDKKELEPGFPYLGAENKCIVHITESAEFKSTVDRLMKHSKMALIVSTSSWKEQFLEAITVSAGGNGQDEEDNAQTEEKLPSCFDYVMHFLTIFWKVLFAFVPPTDYLGGWLCFTVCIIVIGLLTAVIGDLAGGFGCYVGLTDAVTAITFVALGTSLPDTFASKVAACGDKSADGSVGNVTGSNAVNVFLGIGVAWSIAAIYHAKQGTKFTVLKGSLGFSVTIFCILALFAILLLVARRRFIGGELGGPKVSKYITGSMLICLWFLYIILSSLENYCYIEGF